MSLAEKTWRRISLHRVVLAWLGAEKDRRLEPLMGHLQEWPYIVQLLDNADLNDPEQNRQRLRVLYLARHMFVGEISPDTLWYEVSNLTDDDLDDIFAVNHSDWKSAGDQNEIRKVAVRQGQRLETEPASWKPLILRGHTRIGPFTILEGNNRLSAYVLSGRSDLNVPVFVGLSPLRCSLHIKDGSPPFLLYDLWKSS